MAEELKSRRDLEAKLVAKAWKDASFASALKSNPKEAIKKETGMSIPGDINVKIVEENANQVYIVLPKPPSANAQAELSDDQLEAVAGGITPTVASIAIVSAAAGIASAGFTIGSGVGGGRSW